MVVRPLLALLLVAALFSGCVGDGNTVISARDGLSAAKEAAKKWGDDPQLIGLASFETPDQLKGEDYEVRFHIDGDAGDGKSPGWIYEFRAGDRHVGVLYAGGLGVLAEGYEVSYDAEAEAEWGEYFPEVLPKGWIDSTEAAKALKASPEWPATDELLVFWSLSFDSDSDRPLWWVDVESDNASLYAMVDALTGEVVVEDFEDMYTDEVVVVDDPAQPAPAACGLGESQDESSAMLVDPLSSHRRSIPVGAGGYLAVNATAQNMVGFGSIVVRDPEGTVINEVPFETAAVGFTADLGQWGLPEGDYTAEVQVTGALVGLTLEMHGTWYEC